jgi:2'-5' RNA ligase
MSPGELPRRLFVALPVPSGIRHSLSVAQRELRDQLPPRAASWTQPEQLHLTLRFLGEVQDCKVEGLAVALGQAILGVGPIPLVVERLGCFPDARSPRVIWAGVHDPADRLTELQQRVVSATASFTRQPVEKRFVGHLTLARFRQIHRPQAAIIASCVEAAVGRRFGEWTADRIQLMQSELLPAGARHSCLEEWTLSPNQQSSFLNDQSSIRRRERRKIED